MILSQEFVYIFTFQYGTTKIIIKLYLKEKTQEFTFQYGTTKI